MGLTPLGGLAVAGAGLVAGTINTVVGSGSLITFPTLLALGYPPRVANVSNTVGLVPGSVSGAVGYRRELAGQRPRVLDLGICSVAGGLTGAVLLLVLPPGVFNAVVPVLVLAAVVLVVVQPRLSAWLAARGRRPGARPGMALRAGVYATGVYGGYFGAAQGVILVALLSLLLADGLQRLNGLKNVLAALVNGVAALLFIVTAPVAWAPAVILAVTSTIGGQLGAVIGRRLPPVLLRAVTVVVGVIALVQLLR